MGFFMLREQAGKEKQAFAVYSSADESLRFYNRAGVPQAGEGFEGRTADAVYTGRAFDGHRWDAYADDVKTVEVVDEGIAPESTAYWFYRFNRMTSCDLSKLDTGNVVDMRWMFEGCVSLEELDLSGFDTSNVARMRRMFSGCGALRFLDLSSFDFREGVKLGVFALFCEAAGVGACWR